MFTSQPDGGYTKIIKYALNTPSECDFIYLFTFFFFRKFPEVKMDFIL